MAGTTSFDGGPDAQQLVDSTHKAGSSGHVPRRYILYFLQFFGIVVAYVLRVGLSTAAAKVADGSDEKTMVTEYGWTNSQQGSVLGAFFYGYMVMQIPGSWLVARFGPKIVFGWGIVLASVLTIVTPLVSASFPACMAMRILTGFVEGPTYPAMSQQVRDWAPEHERASALSFIMAGSFVGTMLTMPTAAFLVTTLGWRSIFYISGGLGCVWGLAWFLVAADTPMKHGNVHETEMALIGDAKAPQVPLSPRGYLKLMRHAAVWALVAGGTGYCWAYYMVMTELPSYLTTVLHFSLESGGVLGILPFGAITVTAIAGGRCSDLALQRGWQPKTVRCLCYTLAAVGTSVFLVAAGYITEQVLAYVLVVIATAFVGFSIPAYSPNCLEVGGSQTSSVFAIQNTFASITGFVAPAVTSSFTDAFGDANGFRAVFWLTCLIYALCLFAWLGLISTDTIPEGRPSEDVTASVA